MITIPNTNYKASDIQLAQILNSTTKVKGDDTTYVVRKQRKTSYILQKYYLVVTYCDEAKGEWHMLMPKALRESLATSLPFYLDCAMKGVKAPSAKELRMMSAMREFLGK